MVRFSVSSSLVPVDAVQGVAPDGSGVLGRWARRGRVAHGITRNIRTSRLVCKKRHCTRVSVELFGGIAEKNIVEFATVATRLAWVTCRVELLRMPGAGMVAVMVVFRNVLRHVRVVRDRSGGRTVRLADVLLTACRHRARQHREIQPQQRHERRQPTTWTSCRASVSCEQNRHLPSIKHYCD